MLFFKECKKVLFSVTFLIYVVAAFGMYYSQFSSGITADPPPKEGLTDYGMKPKEDPAILMPAATLGLCREYVTNCYIAYPIGFYKEVRLGEKKKNEMAAILSEITGLPRETLDSEAFAEHLDEAAAADFVTYERFRELMRRADALIGGGSSYSDDYIVGDFSLVPMTYEEAVEEYERFLTKDKITGGYARLFCDYMGILLAVMPVFVAAAFFTADKRARMEELIYVRGIASLKLTAVRYAALVCMLVLPAAILVLIANHEVCALYPGYELDLLAIPRLAVCWLVPNIMLAVSVGMLLTEGLSPLIAVFVQVAWWFGDLISGSGELTGRIGRFTLVCRHNNELKAAVFETVYGRFCFNRIFYTLVSLLLAVLTVYIYHRKRRGGIYVLGKHLARKSKA